MFSTSFHDLELLIFVESQVEIKKSLIKYSIIHTSQINTYALPKRATKFKRFPKLCKGT